MMSAQKRAQACISLHERALPRTSLHERAQACTSLHERARACTSLHERAQACTSAHELERARASLTSAHELARARSSLHERARACTSALELARARKGLHERARARTSLHERARPCATAHGHVQPRTSVDMYALKVFVEECDVEVFLDRDTLFYSQQGFFRHSSGLPEVYWPFIGRSIDRELRAPFHQFIESRMRGVSGKRQEKNTTGGKLATVPFFLYVRSTVHFHAHVLVCSQQTHRCKVPRSGEKTSSQRVCARARFRSLRAHHFEDFCSARTHARTHKCTHAHTHACTHPPMCIAICMNMSMDLCIALCIDMCIAMRIAMCIDMCIAMCMGMCRCEPSLGVLGLSAHKESRDRGITIALRADCGERVVHISCSRWMCMQKITSAQAVCINSTHTLVGGWLAWHHTIEHTAVPSPASLSLQAGAYPRHTQQG